MSTILIPSSAKRIVKQILVIANLSWWKDLVLRACVYMIFLGKQLSATEAKQ